MMWQRRLTPLLLATLVLVLAACAGKAIDQDPIIKILAERAAKIEPQALPPLSRSDVKATYARLAKSTNNDALKAIALQRLADLALEDRQDVLAGDFSDDTDAAEDDSENPSETINESQTLEKTEAVPEEKMTAAVDETADGQIDAQVDSQVETKDSAASVPQQAGLSPEEERVLAEDLQDELEDANEQEKVDSAIHQYERLLVLYPDYAGNDRVLYQLARAYELNGNLEKTLEVLTRLVNRYPNQTNLDEIQFRRGEILFTFREFEEAEKAYGSVLVFAEIGSFYERAMFKHGWSVFKQGDTQRSLKSYFSVLDRSFGGGRDLADFSRSELELLEDTLRIVSLSFSYLKGHESISAFFKGFGQRQYEFRIYERLADLYLVQKRDVDAAETFMSFVDRYSQHRFAPLFTVRVIDIYKQAGRKDEVLRAKANLVMGYGVGSAFWEKHDKPLFTQLQPHLKSNLDDLTRYYHAEAQKSKNPKDYRIAAHWYRTYVRAFPKDKSTPEKNMLLAESLLDSGDVKAAGLEFEITAYRYPRFAQSAEAGYAALLAHRQQSKGLKGKTVEQPLRISIASGKRFATNFPADKRAVKVMSKAAEELLVLKDYRNAVATAHHVVGHTPKAPRELLLINWAIIAQGEFKLEQYPQAEAATVKRLSFAAVDDKDRKDHEERLAAAIYKQGEYARAAGKHREAARHFLRVGKLTPKASIRSNADYDAAAALFVNKDWALAIPVLKAFVRTFPSHKLRSGADEKLALAYERSGDWKQAAGAYEVLYRNETDSNKKRQLLWQTAEFYQKAKKQDKAIQTYKRYITTFPGPFDDAIEARHRLATMYKEKGQLKARHYWLGQIIAANKAGPGTDRSHYLAATAELELAEPTFINYRKVRLVQPLKKNLTKKKKLMKESIKAFTAAADYGVEAVTTASTFRIAEIYNDFGLGLFESERPKGLSVDELEQYDILLEEQAYPFEEKAIEVHVVNASRASDGVYDEWVRKSFGALATLSPIRYSKNEKSEEIGYEAN